ncbi:pimeloyl-ACP methyl ester esterase BioH [Thalassotalea euphylliae]|uniref:pimeloyl-ACP methyl ester esterase BioH n=1 Tax=Thalassotalea euphylliae TaxID=1655234 RepID=UPI003643EA16
MAQNLKFSTLGQGQTVALLHGWGLNSHVFKPLADALSASYQVQLIDLPGYGQNQHVVPEPYDLNSVAELVADTLPSDSIVIGWSLGGLVATKIALNHPTKVKALVTIASSPLFAETQDWPGIKPMFLNRFHRQIADNIEQTLQGFLKLQAMGSPHVKDDIRLIQELVMSQPLPNKRALDAGLDILACADLRRELADIGGPFLRIYGKMDGLVPKKVIPMINNIAPRSDVIVFEKASHAPFISNFHMFIQDLGRWLKSSVL